MNLIKLYEISMNTLHFKYSFKFIIYKFYYVLTNITLAIVMSDNQFCNDSYQTKKSVLLEL